MSTLKLVLDAIKELLVAIVAPLGNLFKGAFGGAWTTLTTTFKLRSDEVKRPLLVLVSIIVIVVSLVSIYLSVRTPTPRINFKPFEALGEVTARETIKVAGDRGSIVLLTYDTHKVRSPVFSVQKKSFEATLQKESHLTVDAIETLEIGPQMMDPMGGLPGSKFIELLRKHPQADVLVSFLGAPFLKDADFAQIPTRRPKVIVAMGYSPQLGQLIREDIVQAAITPRFQPAQTTDAQPQTAQEWFDRFYTVVTRDSLDKLPDFLAGPVAK